MEENIFSPANQMEETLVWKLISYIFELYVSYEIKFQTEISFFYSIHICCHGYAMHRGAQNRAVCVKNSVECDETSVFFFSISIGLDYSTQFVFSKSCNRRSQQH